MKREIKEEIGISTPVKYAFKFFYSDDVDRAFRAVFIGKSDKKAIPDPDEMSEIKWVKYEDLVKDVKNHTEAYTPSFVEGINRYCQMQKASLSSSGDDFDKRIPGRHMKKVIKSRINSNISKLSSEKRSER